MSNKFIKKQFVIKSNEFESTLSIKNSIIFQHYDKYIDFSILLNKSHNIPVFHNDNNIEILSDFVNNISTLNTDTYSKIYLIIDEVCFVTLINKTNNTDDKTLSNECDISQESHNETSNKSLYISYKNVPETAIINSILKISFDNSYRNMMLFTVSGFVIGFITKHLLIKRG